MKHIQLLAFAFFLAVAGAASAANIYGGVVRAGSVGGSAAQTQGGSAAALVGVAGTRSSSASGEIGGASATISPAGVTTVQGGASGTTGNSSSGALGFAGAGSTYGGAAGNVQGARGIFGTIGVSPGPVVAP